MGPEAKLYAKVKKRIEERISKGEPIWKVKIHGGPGQEAGVPDILLCVGGLFLAIELKAGTEVSLLQRSQLDRIRRAGGGAYVCETIERVDQVLDEYVNRVMVSKIFGGTGTSSGY